MSSPFPPVEGALAQVMANGTSPPAELTRVSSQFQGVSMSRRAQDRSAFEPPAPEYHLLVRSRRCTNLRVETRFPNNCRQFQIRRRSGITPAPCAGAAPRRLGLSLRTSAQKLLAAEFPARPRNFWGRNALIGTCNRDSSPSRWTFAL